MHQTLQSDPAGGGSGAPAAAAALADRMLPFPPETLWSGEVRLRFVRIVPGDPSHGFAPFYHFRILAAHETDVGHINFRVGESEHIRLSVGHIGFEIRETCRGHGFALQACHAIAPFVRSVYEAVIITCDPDNEASRRTIERVGARFLDEVAIAPHDLQYQRGSRRKRRYQWAP